MSTKDEPTPSESSFDIVDTSSNMVLSTDTSQPSVLSARLHAAWSGEILHREKVNWRTWKTGIRNHLGMCRLGTHILPAPASTAPDPTNEPVAFRNWSGNDLTGLVGENEGNFLPRMYAPSPP